MIRTTVAAHPGFRSLTRFFAVLCALLATPGCSSEDGRGLPSLDAFSPDTDDANPDSSGRDVDFDSPDATVPGDLGDRVDASTDARDISDVRDVFGDLRDASDVAPDRDGVGDTDDLLDLVDAVRPDTGPFEPRPDVFSYALTSLVVAGRAEGFDLDGDGDIDNALRGAALLVNPLLVELITAEGLALVVQLSGVDGLASDGEVALGWGTAQIPEGSSIVLGVWLEAGVQVDPEGVMRATVPTALVDFVYEAVIGSTVLDLPISTLVPVQATGTAMEEEHEGLLGFALPVASLAALLEARGQPEAAELLEGLADLDLDDDGTPESISGALAFESVGCVLSP